MTTRPAPSPARRLGGLALASSLLVLTGLAAADDSGVDYERDVRPILATHCFKCHGGAKRRGGLSLRTRRDALTPGESGEAAIIPGDAERSPLVRLVSSGADADDRMPPRGDPLSADEVATLRRWIDAGAPYRGHWAHQPITEPALPEVELESWARGGIDRFVLARLEREGLSPSPEAEPHALARRLALDLTGLPPSPEQVATVVESADDTTWRRLVDELLDSPRYGERRASPWLDMARYADTQGYEKDNRRTIWRYRDWVIDAYNRDLPFDRFTIEQLAGDLLESPTEDQLLATAFHRNTMTNTEGGTDDEEFRVYAVIDRVNTTWQVWMGTTFGCSQCHDHPYDPYTQREYYSFFAFFNQTEDDDQPDERPVVATPTRAERHQQDELQRRVEELKTAAVAGVGAEEERERLEKELAEARKRLDEFRPTTTPILRELPPDRRRTTHVFVRGSFLAKGDPVEPGVPASLHPFPSDAPPNRLGLARWIVAPDNPLTPRVVVNRLWEQLFGRGLVGTSEDFGPQGEGPSHPELLDWLAWRFVHVHRWSVKALLREIVDSATYRQSSHATEPLLERDAGNTLLARGPRFRLSAEQVRDQALAVSGLLSAKVGGPSVMPLQPDGVWQVVYSGDSWRTSPGEDGHRRGLYTFWRRTSPYPSAISFDATSREFCAVRRVRTNTPLQALVTLNDPVFVEAAQALAREACREASRSDDERIRAVFRRTLLREPRPLEVERLEALLAVEREWYRERPDAARTLASEPLGPLPEGADPVELAVWTVLGNVLLNLDEILTKG